MAGEEVQSETNSAHSASTNVTTPDQSQGNDDDIWASDSESGQNEGTGVVGTRNDLLSDLPTVRRQHMTDGYREGLSVGKAQVMQQGFDNGYPIGMEIGLRVGKVLGVLEGILASKGVSDVPETRAAVQKLYEQAKTELAIANMMKDTNDQNIAEAKHIPHAVLTKVQKWENMVLGESVEQPSQGNE